MKTQVLRGEDFASSQEAVDALSEQASDVSVFVVGDNDKLETSNDLQDYFTTKFRAVVKHVTQEKSVSQKTASTQNQNDLAGMTVSLASEAVFNEKDGALSYIEPPYPPELFEAFMEVDEVNYRCIATKASDTVNRGYLLECSHQILPDKRTPDDGTMYATNAVDAQEFNLEKEQAQKFLDKCNDIIGFEGVLKKGALDYEGIGWAAFEVIRSLDGKIKKLEHVPAVRVRVLKGHKGFVELIQQTEPPYTNGTVVFYLPFGRKLLSKTRQNPITKEFESYDPDEDGPLESSNVTFNLVDKHTFAPTSDIAQAANEILWIPKVHNRSIYYGVSDVVSASGFIFSKVNIRDFLLQFFENNTVPRYAVIVEGANLEPEVVKKIEAYFMTHVKGRNHKTLVLGVPAKGGRTVTVKFEKLQSDEQEGSFQKTRQNDSQGIMVAHGVSPAIIGIHEAASLGSGKGLSQAEIYKDRVITPNQNLWGRAITRLLKVGLGLTHVRLRFDPLDIRDREAEQRMYEGYLRTGATSINTVIKEAGLGEPAAGGDRPFITVGSELVFLDQLEERYGNQETEEAIEKENNNLEKEEESEEKNSQKELLDTDSKKD